MVKYETCERLKQQLLTLAHLRGLDGEPFLSEEPPIGTLDQELQAIYLSVDVQPRPETPDQKAMVRRWARNVVLSSGRKNVQHVGQKPSQTTNKQARAW